MDAAEFANLQTALIWVLGPLAMWMAALVLAGGIFSSVFVIFMALYRRLSR